MMKGSDSYGRTSKTQPIKHRNSKLQSAEKLKESCNRLDTKDMTEKKLILMNLLILIVIII